MRARDRYRIVASASSRSTTWPRSWRRATRTAFCKCQTLREDASCAQRVETTTRDKHGCLGSAVFIFFFLVWIGLRAVQSRKRRATFHRNSTGSVRGGTRDMPERFRPPALGGCGRTTTGPARRDVVGCRRAGRSSYSIGSNDSRCKGTVHRTPPSMRQDWRRGESATEK